VIGVLAAIALLAIAVWFCLRRRRARRSDVEMAKHHESPVSAAAPHKHGEDLACCQPACGRWYPHKLRGLPQCPSAGDGAHWRLDDVCRLPS
jgi:ABC-type nickel/cobalt efflux system permease component RcnA